MIELHNTANPIELIKGCKNIVLFVLCLIVLLPPVTSYGSPRYSSLLEYRRDALGDDLEKATDKLYKEALSGYDHGEYWDCARDLIILMDFNPQFSKIDDVVLKLGTCLYELELLEGAAKIFKHLVVNYPRSPLIPEALLGLQKIEYEKSDYVRCIEFYNVIDKGYPDREVVNASRYFAGLSNYHLKDYSNAVSVLAKVDNDSEFYDHALYTAALSLLRIGSVRRAALVFRRLTSLPVVSPERRRVIDEGFLTLGYIYYELGRFQQALKYFKSVSSDHENYDEALLAAGWAAVKLNAYEQAIPHLTKLVRRSPTNKDAEEAYFLLGRCYLKLGFYDEAILVYERLMEIFPTEDVIPAIINETYASLNEEQGKIEKMKMDLLVLETKLLDSISLGQREGLPTYIKNETDRLVEIRDGLVNRITHEREFFHQLSTSLEELRNMAQTKESRRDWRAFAEYGRSRAMFLKRTQ